MSSKKLIEQLIGTNVDDRLSKTLLEDEIKKDTKSPQFTRLKNHVWGIGIEHEMHVFHRPKFTTTPIIDFTMYNTKDTAEKLLYRSDISDVDRDFLKRIPFELSGRKCFDEYSLKPVPIEMPEFITTKPFSSLSTGKRPIELYCSEIRKYESDYMSLLRENSQLAVHISRYGNLHQFPFGMSNFIKIPKDFKTSTYRFNKSLYTDYLGSFHLTLTLPFTDKTPKDKFIKMHQNFGNQLQWVEPLLIAAFFSTDQLAVGTTENRIKGSYRVLRIGWGNLAGSDVRQFNRGIGRYAVIKPYWRNGLNYHNKDKTKICEKVSPRIRKDSPRAVSGFSSNFRTFGSTDPERPMHRESGLGMNAPNGIEIRIFDNFDSLYLDELCKFVIYVAENSRVHHSKDYVYQNKHWIKATQDIMMKGWTARVSDEYVDLLRKNLGLKINTRARKAYDVIVQINKELWEKNKDGDWTYLMLEKKYKEAPILPQINRRSWEFALMIKMNRHPELIKRYNKMIKELPSETDMKGFEKIFFKYFDKLKWERDSETFAYFLHSQNVIDIETDKEGNIETINKHKSIKSVNNFNEQIIKEWERPFFMEIVNLLKSNKKLGEKSEQEIMRRL